MIKVSSNFPVSYMFELSKSELRDLRSKISTTNVSPMNRNSTKVFTERGLYMLATIFIDSRWKDEVKDVLVKKFPDMTEDEWEVLESILFL